MADMDSNREGTVPPPKCKAILLCERVIIEQETHQVSLIGLFDEMEVVAVPGELQAFNIYMLLTDGITGHPYDTFLEIRDLQADVVVVRAAGSTIQWNDRLETRDLFFEIPPQPIERVGMFEAVVFADHQEIDRHRFKVFVSQTPDEEDQFYG
jgi:hypothetical protein